MAGIQERDCAEGTRVAGAETGNAGGDVGPSLPPDLVLLTRRVLLSGWDLGEGS